MADAQTSGGLIFGVDKDRSSGACAELNERGVAAVGSGETLAGSGTIRLR